MKHLITTVLALALCGCSATFSEKHHFATVDARTGEVQNIFRVTVEGDASLTNARYVSGYYDERAVDLFFNELSSTPIDMETTGAVPPIFKTVNCAGLDDKACKAKQDQALRTVPVGSNLGKDGSFVMILSTNADAIAGTIGSFAENQLVMESVLFLATKDEQEEAARISARATAKTGLQSDTVGNIKSLSNLQPTTDDAREELWLSVLRTAAAGLVPNDPPRFEDIGEAREWFEELDREIEQ